jgi:hypothetical protein
MKKSSLLLPVLALLLGAAAPALRVPAGAETALLTLPDGFKVSAELALTPEAKEKGLMFRTELPPDRGMLFVFGETAPRSFWMKNTYIDLDIVFLDGDLKILKVFHRVPRSFQGQPEGELARAYAPAACVLELAAGAARAHKLKPGAKLQISFPPKKTAPPAKAGK